MKLWNYIFRDDFIKKSLLFFIVTGLISFLNYVFHPVVGRLVSVSDFGEIETLFSLYNVFGIFLFAFTSVVIHVTANNDNESERNANLAKIGLTGIVFSFIIAALTALASPLLQNTFHFQSPIPFVVFASLLPVATYVFFGSAFFQAQKRVYKYSAAHAAVSLLKLLFALVLLAAGYRVVGAMGAFFLAQMFGALYVMRALRGKISVLSHATFTPEDKSRLLKEVRYGFMILVANFSVILFCNGDILAVKYFFEPESAGYYGGISAIGNIVYFATAPIAAMLLASVKLKNTYKENQRVLYLALLAVGVLVGFAVLIFGIWHRIIITMLLGARFAEYSWLLVPISVIMALSALYNIILMYFLGLRKKTVFIPAIASFLTLVILLGLRNSRIIEVVHNFIAAIVVGIVVGFLVLIWELNSKKVASGSEEKN